MKQYKLITGPDDGDFCDRVSDLLNQGWKLSGDPSITFNGEKTIAAQALVKKVKNASESVDD